ncbi:hypothetical protein ABIC22_005998 [Paenibacillus sp. PvP094]|uniref:hypothetical protein n=1 Tax=Paenibacillus sp. PvP094 TaxID=3156394 RepID=UPI003391D544
MSFTQNLPEWKAEGIEPSETQKQTGFQPGMKPPAQWFNWVFNWTYLALKELQEKAAEKSIVDLAIKDIQDDVLQNQDYAEKEFGKLSDRLDTSERSEVTLQPGLQVIQGKRNAPFNLNSIKGKTLVNLLGRVGGCEFITGWTKSTSATIELSTTNVNSGSNSFKVTQGGTAGPIYVRTPASEMANVDPSKYYIAIAWIKNETTQSFSTRLVTVDGSVAISGAKSGTILAGASGLVWRAYTPTEMGNNMKAYMDVYTAGSVATGAAFYIDSYRIYQISADEYSALETDMTAEQIAAKYPYVDSVQPVRNPYAIRYGENLLPPFYEWSVGTQKFVLNGPYDATRTATASGGGTSINLPVVTGQDYTLSYESSDVSGGYINFRFLNAEGIGIGSWSPANALVQTMAAPENATHIQVLATGTVTGAFTFKNPMLTIGTTAKPFKPREDAMLALQTDLYADPLTGTNADEVFEKDGQYFKLKKWYKVDLNGEKIISAVKSHKVGYTTVYPKLDGTSYDYASMTATAAVKYDGKILTWGSHETAADGWAIDKLNSNFAFSISNADSGWGDAYTPTTDEIKAYFMGWKMGVQGGNRTAPYEGTGSKVWYKITMVTVNGSATLQLSDRVLDAVPSVFAGTDSVGTTYTPYQLVYQLATPTVEPITSEGQLTLIEGNNQVEVGTGIVLREPNTAGLYSNTYYLNDTVYGKPLKYKVSDILAIFRNNQRDYKWTIYSGNNQYGNKKASLASDKYDPSATYAVTYFMLDKSPAAPFVGSVPDNEKSLLTDLIQDVQQANARISVVESKKAERDSPAWITPTLLNSWVRHSTARPTLRYYKDSQGVVHLEGVIRSGVVTSGTALCNLPVGYRPALTVSCISYSSNGTTVAMGLIDVLNDGTIQLGTTGTPTFYNGLMFIALSFLAEQ